VDHDLRHDPDAHAIDARNLRTVPFRDPRYAADCRTADDKMRAEFVRLVDALQALRLQFDVLIEEQARTITALEAYIHDHSEAEE
jgi:hypothetical protein